MAIRPETEFPGKIIAGNADYPQGKARNVTLPGDGTGTPFRARLVNDLFGFFQRLLNDAGITPSGNPDTVPLSDYKDALDNIFSRLGIANVFIQDQTIEKDGSELILSSAPGAAAVRVLDLGASAPGRALVTSNAGHSTGAWLRDDISKDAWALQFGGGWSSLSLFYAPAGSNPISWTEIVQFDSAGVQKIGIVPHERMMQTVASGGTSSGTMAFPSAKIGDLIQISGQAIALPASTQTFHQVTASLSGSAVFEPTPEALTNGTLLGNQSRLSLSGWVRVTSSGPVIVTLTNIIGAGSLISINVRGTLFIA